MIIGFGNNVVSSLAADITANQTTIQVMPGAGALFSGLLTYEYLNDSNPLKTYAKITLTDAKETVFEVCHLTAVNNDVLTVVRGQEGTDRKGWSLNDVIANFATRGSENQFVQIEQLQSGHYTSAVAGGTANGLTVALPATYFLNGSTDWALKTPILIYPTLNNTGASTLQLTMGGRVMGTYPLVKGSNTALRAWDIVAKNPFLAVFNADQGRFALLNPTTSVGAVLSVNSHTPDAAGNVKLGTAADADVGTATGNVMQVGAFGLGRGSNHKDDAYNNIGEIYRVNGSSVNTPTTGVAGVISLPCDGGPSTAYAAVSNSGAAWVGSSSIQANGIKWYRVYTTAYKPTAQDTGALPLTGGTVTGPTTFSDQLNITGGDFIRKSGVNTHTDNGVTYNQTNGVILQGVGDQYAQSYALETVGQRFALRFRIHSGGLDSWPEFRNDGSVYIAGNWPAIVNSAGGIVHPDGNLQGPCWEGDYLSNWLLEKVTPVGAALPWPTENPPPGWMLCNGAGFDRSAFPRLAAVFPNGLLPDYRGAFLRGKDNGRGIDPGRGLGDIQWSQNAAHTHTYTKFQYGQTGNKFSLDDVWFGPIDVETGASGGNESRPTNVSVNYIVRAA